MMKNSSLAALALPLLWPLACGAPVTPPIAPPTASAQPVGSTQATIPAPRKEGRFTILQINDVYRIEGIEGGTKGGLARVRALRKQLESEGRPVIVLHAGDLLFPSVMSKFLRGEPMIKVLNMLDGDAEKRDDRLAVTFGNHEFEDKDPALLLGRVAESDFAWISTNTRYRTSKTAAGEPFGVRVPNVYDTRVMELGGVKVGIFAITIDDQEQDYVRYVYKKPERDALVRDAITSLKKQGADVIVALTHQDIDDDVHLASTSPEVDLVVGGHEHFYIERKVGKTWVTKADADAVSALVHDVRVQGGVVETAHRKVLLDASIPGDPAVDAVARAWIGELTNAIKGQTGRDPSEVIGETKNILEGVEPAVRGRETALGNFLADVVRDKMKTDVGFINGGGIRINDNIRPGPVTGFDIEGIFYYDNKLVSFELSGAELLDVLRTSVAKVHAGSGQFLQVASIRFTYHVGGTPEEPTYRIDPADVQIRKNGAKDYAPLDLGTRYSVATVDYVWKKGCRDGFKVFSAGCEGKSPTRTDKKPDIGWRSTTEAYIAALPGRRITTDVEGRIVRAEK